jgi:hypothetical protein
MGPITAREVGDRIRLGFVAVFGLFNPATGPHFLTFGPPSFYQSGEGTYGVAGYPVEPGMSARRDALPHGRWRYTSTLIAR